jgi:hypothetical protein
VASCIEKPNSKYVDGYLPAHWSTYNNYVPLYISFPESHEGQLAKVWVLIHHTPADGQEVPKERWQTLNLKCVATPKLSKPPKRLVTSITWASIGEDLFMDKAEEPLDYWLNTYRQLGFNTVPQVSMPAAFMRWTKDNTTLIPMPTANSYTFPAGRRGKAWKGLLYGPQISLPNPSEGPSTCRKSPNASLLPVGLTAGQIAIEMNKWQNAFEFTNRTTHLDLAYDGIFSQRATLHFCELLKSTKPDWVYVDDEAFGEGWETWKFEASLSANAQSRAMPGEKPLDLAWRMAAEMMADFTHCLDTESPMTNVHWYGYGPECPFPDRIFADAGISMGPSEYGQPHYLAQFVDSLRQVKQQQAPMRNGRPRHLLPWLTACTYGQMDAVQAWEEALHAFGAGATGFSFFGVFFHGCFDDPAKLLALSSAVSLATPYEDYFLDGVPLVKGALTASAGELRAWSGVQFESSLWLVVTPGDDQGHTRPSTLTLQVVLSELDSFEQPVAACDLTTGRKLSVVHIADGSLTISNMQLARTTVLHVGPDLGDKCEKVPSDVWLPEPGYNFVM